MKCAHPPCTCQIDDADGFCDPACMDGAGDTCLCGNPQCEAAPGGEVEPEPLT